MLCTIQIRNVPEALHRNLEIRATLLGNTLSDYLRQELERIAEHPTRQELLERLTRKPREEISPSAAELVRRDRDAS